ncbi:MAG: leucine-rich repeat domain-containing protein [Promethearchaeota archaeon]
MEQLASQNQHTFDPYVQTVKNNLCIEKPPAEYSDFMRIILDMFYKGNIKKKLEKDHLVTWLGKIREKIVARPESYRQKNVSAIIEVLQQVQHSYLEDLKHSLSDNKSLDHPFEIVDLKELSKKRARDPLRRLLNLFNEFEKLLMGVLEEGEQSFFRKQKGAGAGIPKYLQCLLSFVFVYGQEQNEWLARKFFSEAVLPNPKKQRSLLDGRIAFLAGEKTGPKKERIQLLETSHVLDDIDVTKTQFFFGDQEDTAYYRVIGIKELFCSLTMLVSLSIIFNDSEALDKVINDPNAVKNQIMKVLHPLWPYEPEKPARITQEKLQQFGLQKYWRVLEWGLSGSQGGEEPTIPINLSLEALVEPIDPRKTSPEQWLEYFSHHWEKIDLIINSPRDETLGELMDQEQKWLRYRLGQLLDGNRGLGHHSLADVLVSVPPLSTTVEPYWASLMKEQRAAVFTYAGMGKSQTLLYLAARWKKTHPDGEILVCSDSSDMTPWHWQKLDELLRSASTERPLLLIVDDLHHNTEITHKAIQEQGFIDNCYNTNTWWLAGYTCSAYAIDKKIEEEYQSIWVADEYKEQVPKWNEQWQEWKEYFNQWSQWVATISNGQYQPPHQSKLKALTTPWDFCTEIAGLREKTLDYFQDRPDEARIYWLLAALFLLHREKPVPLKELIYVLEANRMEYPEFIIPALDSTDPQGEARLITWIKKWGRSASEHPRFLPPLEDQFFEPDLIDFFHQKRALDLWDQIPDNIKPVKTLLDLLTNAYDGIAQVLELLEEDRHKSQKQIALSEIFTRLRVKNGKLIGIDLSNTGLIRFPKGIGNVRDLTELHLSGNQFQTVDLRPLSRCLSLQIFDLSQNQLQTVDLSPLAPCLSLQTLNLDQNQLQTVDLTPLAPYPNLQTLSLSQNQLQTVDLRPLAQCPNLQTLSLSQNQLQTVDLRPLAQCPNLQTLNLFRNRLQVVDLTPVAQCSKLQTLSLGQNRLQTVDLQPLAQCSKFQTLNLEHNQLQMVDLSSLAQCPKLEELSLLNNQLQLVNLQFLASCPSLRKLNLGQNQLEMVDLTPLVQCPNLQELYLFDNQLKTVDLTPVAQCPKLQTLGLSQNQLEKVDLTSVAQCPNLQELNLGQNLLKRVDLTPVIQCPNLEILNLGQNQLEKVDLTPLAECLSLQRFSLSQNQLEKVDLRPLAQCPNLQTLSLNTNQFQTVDLTPLAECLSLNTLNLGQNQLQTVDLTPLAECLSLHTLSLGQNQLQTVDLTPLAQCINLRRLNLSQNRFQTMDLTPLAQCLNLQILNLSQNRFQTVNLAPLTQCHSLQTLNLSQNRLKTVNLRPLGQCSKLQTVYLFDNRLQSVNLTPLARCPKFQTLNLSQNNLQAVSLRPLAQCPNLQALYLSRNQLQVIDLTPLALCFRLKTLDFRNNTLKSVDLTPLVGCSNLNTLNFDSELKLEINVKAPAIQKLIEDKIITPI